MRHAILKLWPRSWQPWSPRPDRCAKIVITPWVGGLVLALALWGCASNPPAGGRRLVLTSDSDEIQFGRASDGTMRREMGVYQDPSLQRYVSGIGARLAHAAHRST